MGVKMANPLLAQSAISLRQYILCRYVRKTEVNDQLFTRFQNVTNRVLQLHQTACNATTAPPTAAPSLAIGPSPVPRPIRLLFPAWSLYAPISAAVRVWVFQSIPQSWPVLCWQVALRTHSTRALLQSEQWGSRCTAIRTHNTAGQWQIVGEQLALSCRWTVSTSAGCQLRVLLDLCALYRNGHYQQSLKWHWSPSNWLWGFLLLELKHYW